MNMMCLIYFFTLMQVHFLLWPEMCTKGKRVVRWARCKRCIFRCTYYIQVDFNISRMSKFSGRLVSKLLWNISVFRIKDYGGVPELGLLVSLDRSTGWMDGDWGFQKCVFIIGFYYLVISQIKMNMYKTLHR